MRIAIQKLFGKSFSAPAYLDTSYIPSLDGLRALSILIVLMGHLHYSANLPPRLARWFDIIAGGGQLGVKLFFVISGFLITTLLFKEKIKTGTINLRKFYLRRFLRIFPVFYLYLFVLIVLNFFLPLHLWISSIILAGLYLVNFFMSSVHWTVMHSWSLSVEEQYYLLWPSLFRKGTRLAAICAIVAIMLAPVLRVIVYYHRNLAPVTFSPFFDGADCIFMGSMLAFAAFSGIINWSFFEKYRTPVILVGFFLMWFIANSVLHGRYGKVLLPLGTTFTAACFCFIIICLVIPGKNFFFWLFNTPPLKWIGRLSYSIYVWQQLFLLAPEGFPHRSFSWNQFPLNIVLIAAVSMLSYFLFEKYFLSIKAKFKV